MDTGNPDLVAFIREKIRRDGPVRFDWFMEQALYHPQHGYYSSGRCEIGRRGDYFTNVSVGPLFGGILAAQFAEMWELLDRPGEFTVVEQGAHEGDFARDVLEAARDAMPDFFGSLHYCVVEAFPVLRVAQQKTLADFKKELSWHASLEELEAFCGVHFSNELLDSMPVRLIRHEDREWREIFVTESDGRFSLVAQPTADDTLRQRIAALPEIGDGGYETEVNLAAPAWTKSVASKLERGFVLAVDYGYPRAEFYAP
ncbi:MAG TPA: SAM-dependent methyltransferase, partial [Chthoniobacterales bacterium]|nr:SAM-dependent methyltransferase [Chthoniobacterales bacterium]